MSEGTQGTSVEANSLRGGQLYDAYWEVTGVMSSAEPTTDHPLWATRPDTTSNTRTGADTWRCKECHGWDYKGVDGRYADGDHRTGFPGILNTSLSAAEIIASLKDTHGYGTVMSEQDLNDVASFVKERLLDPGTLLVPDTTTFDGDATAGQPTFDNTCAACHGPEGLNPQPTGSAGGFEEFPGFLANDNAWEFVHKVRFGQPGTAMPPQADVLDEQELADLAAYVQTLPQSAM